MAITVADNSFKKRPTYSFTSTVTKPQEPPIVMLTRNSGPPAKCGSGHVALCFKSCLLDPWNCHLILPGMKAKGNYKDRYHDYVKSKAALN